MEGTVAVVEISSMYSDSVLNGNGRSNVGTSDEWLVALHVVDSDIGAVHSSSRNGADVRNTLWVGHADGDITATGNGDDRNVGSAAFTNHACSEEDAVFGDTNV